MKPKLKLPLLSNRAGAPGEDWFHLVPKGEFDHPDSGVVQVIDDVALESIVTRFNAEAGTPDFRGLLVDQEHFSYDPTKSSEAFGWVRELQNRENGTWGRVEWTEPGKAAVDGRTYKSISPVWFPRDVEPLGGKRVRPLRLDSFGLTNTPNLKGMVPLANRDASTPKGYVAPDVCLRAIARALGISGKATEVVVVSEIGVLKNRIAELERGIRLEAEFFADEALAPIKNRTPPEVVASLRESLITNRLATMPILNLIKQQSCAPGTRVGGPLTNRRTAGNPAGLNGTSEEDKADQIRLRIGEIIKNRRCTYSEAKRALRSESPHLFQKGDR